MAQQDMYAGVNNSVPTQVVGGLTATATIVDVEDGTVFPAGPNIATIGNDDDAELVYYTAVEGNSLTGCVRGYNGTLAAIWPEGTLCYRAYTAVDHQRFKANIEDLAAGKVDMNGDGSGVTAVFTQAATRQNVVSGESGATLWGKTAKWFADLKDGAFAAFGTGNGDVARGDHLHGQYAVKPGTAVADHLYMADGEGNLADSGLLYTQVVSTAEQVLALLLTVGGAGSGLDADLFKGNSVIPIDNGGTGADTRQAATVNLQTMNFGVGKPEVARNSDLNNYIAPGIYSCVSNGNAGTLTNSPVTVRFALWVELPFNTTTEIMQTVWPSNYGQMYRRFCLNNVWQGWIRFAGTSV